MASKTLNWMDYIASCTRLGSGAEQLSADTKQTIIRIRKQFDAHFFTCIPMMYLIDYRSGDYLMTSSSSKTVLGHDAERFMSGGIGFTLDNYHRDDLKLYDTQMFPDRLKFLKSIPSEDHPNYLFSYNFRIKDGKGHYVNLLQRNSFIKSTEKGLPLQSLGMVINMDQYKTESPVIQTIEKMNADGSEMPTIVHKKAYYLNKEDKLFSTREKEILLWTSEGFTSKEIADKLFISEHTVINHRRNMQLKANCPNSTALVSFAIRQGII